MPCPVGDDSRRASQGRPQQAPSHFPRGHCPAPGRSSLRRGNLSSADASPAAMPTPRRDARPGPCRAVVGPRQPTAKRPRPMPVDVGQEPSEKTCGAHHPTRRRTDPCEHAPAGRRSGGRPSVVCRAGQAPRRRTCARRLAGHARLDWTRAQGKPVALVLGSDGALQCHLPILAFHVSCRGRAGPPEREIRDGPVGDLLEWWRHRWLSAASISHASRPAGQDTR